MVFLIVPDNTIEINENNKLLQFYFTFHWLFNELILMKITSECSVSIQKGIM